MNNGMQIWLPPMLSMLGALIVVVFTAWINGRWITAEIKQANAEVKQQMAEMELRLVREMGEIKARIQKLEDRAGIIYHP